MQVKTLAHLLAVLALGAGGLFFWEVTSTRRMPLMLPKLLAAAFSPYVAVMGALGALLGLVSRAPLAVAAGATAAALAGRYTRRVAAPHGGFERAFGADWASRIPADRASRMLQRRWAWRLPASPEPRWERDVVFWTVPGSERRLLCDVWQPPLGVPPSGLAFVYLHGSGWHYLDKDFWTRPMFRHLAAQGHVVMDVGYRLCPEVDVREMLGDAKRAIAWLKHNAERYGVDPRRIVVAGGSAGGHLALLAAYTPGHPALTPPDLEGVDTSVRAVVSYYGPTDLAAYHERARGPLGMASPAKRPASKGDRITADLLTAMGVHMEPRTHPEMMKNLLGGLPDEVPAAYELASPVTHVSADCPPTLLFQGEHDALVPVQATRTVYHKLAQAGVPAVYVEFPQTDHAFDLILPRFSPSAQAALYDLDRFLALMAGPGEFRARPAAARIGFPNHQPLPRP